MKKGEEGLLSAGQDPFDISLLLFQNSEILNWLKMGEERWRLPPETLDLIFQLLSLTDLKSAVQVFFVKQTNNNNRGI